MDLDWNRLAEQVTARREQLGVATRRELADATGLSYRLLGDVERGTRPVSDGSLAILEHALAWEPGSARAVLEGGKARALDTPVPTGPHPEGWTRAVSDAYEIAAELTAAGQVSLGTRLAGALGQIGVSLSAYAKADGIAGGTGSPSGARPSSGDIAPPTVLGIALGRYLRLLRQRQSLTPQRVAELVGCSVPEVHLLELGRITMGKAKMRHLLGIYAVEDPHLQQECIYLAEEAGKSGWWTHYNDILPSWFESYLHLEASARSIRTFEMQLIPGLLQTADYARSVMGVNFDPELDRKVRLRMERKKILDGPARPQLWAVIDEAAIRGGQVPIEMMCDQVRHLIEMSQLPNVVIQILPAQAKVAGACVPFSLLRFRESEIPDIVYTEQLTSALYLDRAEDIAPYIALADRLAVVALPPRESADFLLSLFDELNQRPHITTRSA